MSPLACVYTAVLYAFMSKQRRNLGKLLLLNSNSKSYTVGLNYTPLRPLKVILRGFKCVKPSRMGSWAK